MQGASRYQVLGLSRALPAVLVSFGGLRWEDASWGWEASVLLLRAHVLNSDGAIDAAELDWTGGVWQAPPFDRVTHHMHLDL